MVVVITSTDYVLLTIAVEVYGSWSPYHCSGTTSICRMFRQPKFTENPVDLPITKTKLYFDLNDIASVKMTRLGRFTSLTFLSLSHNRLTSFHLTKSMLRRLEKLNLYRNAGLRAININLSYLEEI